MSKFQVGDKVVVTNIDGYTENGVSVFGIFDVQGIGDVGTVFTYEPVGTPWQVGVEHDYGFFFYAETELEHL